MCEFLSEIINKLFLKVFLYQQTYFKKSIFFIQHYTYAKSLKITKIFEHKSNAAENAVKPSTSGQTSSSETEQRSEQLKVHWRFGSSH